MAKFYGKIGYAETIETAPGVWSETIIERNYAGDVLKLSQRWQVSEKINDDLTINNSISIIGDEYAYRKLSAMKYVKWMGASWKITNIDVQRPRLILTIGGVYNGDEAGTPDNA